MFGVICIVFACVAANHLGLVQAIEDLADTSLPIINCSKCLTFWCVLAYAIFHTGLIVAIATAFACSAIAQWVELLMYAADTLFMYCYGKVSNRTAVNDTTAAAACGGVTESTVPKLRRKKSKTKTLKL